MCPLLRTSGIDQMVCVELLASPIETSMLPPLIVMPWSA
jgi:hypothetical protein